MSLTATQEQIDRVRLYCFNPTPEQLSDEVIGAQIEKWLNIYHLPEQEPYALFNATLDCLRYLIFLDKANQGAGTRRREQVGEVWVEVENKVGWVSRWQWILDQYLDGSLTFPDVNRGSSANVIIGGVDRQEVNRIATDVSSVNGLHGIASVSYTGNRGVYHPFRNTSRRYRN